MIPALDTDHEFKLKAQADKLKLLYHQSFPAVFVSIMIALLLSTVLWSQIERPLLLGWLCFVLLSSVFRLALFFSYFRTSPNGISLLNWEKPYVITLLFSASVWGIGSAWMISIAPIVEQPVIYSCLMGMAGGAISVYSASRFLVLSTIITILLPSTIWFLLQDELIPIMLGLSGILFLTSATRASKVLSNTLHQSFLLTHQLTAAKESAEAKAKIDVLTGLNNRAAFTELSEAQTQYCRRHKLPLSLILLDVDKFKDINDSLGHFSGDLALQHLAKIIQKSIRSSDICGRIGGEEFAITLPNADAADATNTAEKIRNAVESQPVDSPDGPFKITASFGIATSNQDTDQLLREADKAMYHVKGTGRNQVHHYDD